MSASGIGHGRGHRFGNTARILLWALSGLLAVGMAGSLMMSLRAGSDARREIVEQAATIAERSLTLAFVPEDLEGPVDPERATELSQRITAVVLDPSDFTTVTLYGADGTILYTTDLSRIGTQLVGEQGRIQEALKGIPQNREEGGTFSTMQSFRFPSGVGRPAVVELLRDAGPIGAAVSPWRTMALFLFVILVLLMLVAWGVGRITAATAGAGAAAADAPRPQQLMPAPRQGARPAPRAAPAAAPAEERHPGLREEGEARRRAEERAREAEDRLALLQEQYRKTLEELQSFQQLAREAQASPDPRLEERALRAEGQVQTLEQQVALLAGEREQLAQRIRDLEAARPEADADAAAASEAALRDARQESVGLRAELEGAQAQLEVTRRELETLRSRAGEADGGGVPEAGVYAELASTKDALATAESQLRSARRELDEARTEMRALRAEEQRATMLADELRAAKASVASLEASHRAELVEREAEFEEKVRATREEFQRQLAEIEASYKGQMGKREADLAGRIAEAEAGMRRADREVEALRAELEAARAEASSRDRRLVETAEELQARRAEADALRAELEERDRVADAASAQAAQAGAVVDELQAEIDRAHEAVAQLREELTAERARAADAVERAERADRERATLAAQTASLGQQFDAAAAENADLNRRLQEIESRRQLELADDQGRAAIDELLRVTQERLAGQTEKLMAAEDRGRDLEAELTATLERIEVAETELRTHRMSEALKEMREGEHAEAADGQVAPALPVLEDRRAATPFTQELSLDAKKTLARIMGITQILKHKRDGKEQAQLIKQLTTYARRLDHTVADLAEADALASGEIELQVKRTDLEALVQRVVEESGVDADHDVRVVAEPLVIGVDARRTEQIMNGLLRASGERTPTGREIVVRLGHTDGGALLSVEDPEPSSDASLSPVVKRFTEVQGGWAKVESREDGGSAFRVFLPDAAPASDEVKVLVDGEAAPAEDDAWNSDGERILVEELHRLAEMPEKDRERPKSGRARRRVGRKG